MASDSVWWRLGAISGCSAVALGAFGAHALQVSTSNSNIHKTWDTAVIYHFVHAFALCLVPLASSKRKPAHMAGTFFAWGTLLFSGSLYLYAVTRIRALKAITPVGGVCFMLGWISLALGK